MQICKCVTVHTKELKSPLAYVKYNLLLHTISTVRISIIAYLDKHIFMHTDYKNSRVLLHRQAARTNVCITHT